MFAWVNAASQRVNREVLTWLKLWDACVFNQHTRQLKAGLDPVRAHDFSVFHLTRANEKGSVVACGRS